eukprot:scaffold14030_cov121-Isochrysis_galbana.AAC.1
MWRIRARRVGPSLLLDRGREWQAQGQLPARGARAGRQGNVGAEPGSVGGQSAHLGGETGGIIVFEMKLLRIPGREAAAARTAAAICQEPRRSALAAANRAAPAAPAGPTWAGKAGPAAPSSFQTQGALRGAMRARCPPGCRALRLALGDVPTPTLPGTDRQPQRARPPKLVFPIIMCPDKAGWARQRRLEPPASTDSARARFTSVEVATVLAVRACSALESEARCTANYSCRPVRRCPSYVVPEGWWW